MTTKTDKGIYLDIINGKYITKKFWTSSVIIISLLPKILLKFFKEN